MAARGWEREWGDEKVLKLIVARAARSVSTLKAIDLHSSNERTVWYINYISVTLLGLFNSIWEAMTSRWDGQAAVRLTASGPGGLGKCVHCPEAQIL